MPMNRPPRVALALSSGGARGFAHVGVIKALRRAGIEIAHVAGSSMGSIMAAGYAIRGDADELERQVLAWRPRDQARRGLLGLPVMHPGRITDLFHTKLGGADFSDCAVPLSIVATDLRRREPVTLTAGPMALAIYASMAMPFLHRPVTWEGRVLAEGALSCLLPLAQASGPHAPRVDLVIGSMTSADGRHLEAVMTGLSHSVGRAYRGWQRHYVDYFRARRRPPVAAASAAGPPAFPPALVLMPEIDHMGSLEFRRAREAIAAGERAVEERLDEITALLATA